MHSFIFQNSSWQSEDKNNWSQVRPIRHSKKMKYHLHIFLLLIPIMAFPQGTPQGISYQAVAYDSEGFEISNQDISVRLGILLGELMQRLHIQRFTLLQQMILVCFPWLSLGDLRYFLPL